MVAISSGGSFLAFSLDLECQENKPPKFQHPRLQDPLAKTALLLPTQLRSLRRSRSGEEEKEKCEHEDGGMRVM